MAGHVTVEHVDGIITDNRQVTIKETTAEVAISYNLVQVKLFPCFLMENHALKAYWGSGSITPHILDFGTRGR
jgi:hypothetical protein